MTPLISEMVKFAPDPELYFWFDVGRLAEQETLVVDDQLVALPYQKTIVVGIDADGSKFMLVLIGGDDSVAVSGIMDVGNVARQYIEPFSYVNTPEGMRVYGLKDEPPPRSHYMPVMAIVSTFLRGLSGPTTAHVPTARKSLINSKRAAKGKGPVLFDWHTVNVGPVTQKMPYQGGTHASPRLHDRRGHWRTYKATGRRVWVRDCKVGDASKGVVFKDYQVEARGQE